MHLDKYGLPTGDVETGVMIYKHPLPVISQGLGDTVAKITSATGLDKLSKIYEQVTGRPCGCASRQEALNKLFPYNITETQGESNG